MDRNIRIAKELVMIAKELTAANSPTMGKNPYKENYKWFVVWYSNDGKALIDRGFMASLDAAVCADIIASKYGYKTEVFRKEELAQNGIDVTDESQWETLPVV